MRCFILLAACLVCVSQVTGAEMVPFRGMASSEYEIDYSKTIPIQCDYDADGDGQLEGGIILALPGTHQGNFSHLGKTSGTSTVIYETCYGTYTMDIDLVSANGDSIHLTGEGYDVLPPGADGGITSFARFDIDGGTGRFAGASGNVDLSGLRYDDLATGTSIDTFDLDGAISTVGASRFASPITVPEPTSLAMLVLGGTVLRCLTRRRRR